MCGSDLKSFILTKLTHKSRSDFVLKQLKRLKKDKGNKWNLGGKLADTEFLHVYPCYMYMGVICIVHYISMRLLIGENNSWYE